MNAERTPQCSSPCCGALLWKQRARRLGYSVMTWWRMTRFFRPTNRMSRSVWRQRSRRFARCLFRHDRRAFKLVENFGTLAVFVQEKLACDLVQAFGQRRRKLFGIGARIFTMDRAHRIDVLLDQFERDAGGIGRVSDQPAKTLSHGCDGRVPERRRFALDVVRGVKERICFGPSGILGESAAGFVQPITFGIHPTAEFAR